MNRLLKSFCFVILGSLIFISFSTKAVAHGLLENTITIDGDYITETELPPPSTLHWSEHINSKYIEPGKQVLFSIDQDKVGKVFGGDNFKYIWEVKNIAVVEAETASITFPAPGAYILNLFISQNGVPLTLEEITIQVGNLPPASGITTQEGTETTNRLMLISREETYTFKAINPDTTTYKYTWDMGDGDLSDAVEVSKQFKSTQLPNYVVLRTTDLATNTYTDSYVRIESELEYENGVPMPPFRPENESEMSNTGLAINISPVNLVLAALVGLLLLSVSAYLVIKFRERHTRSN